MKIRYVGPDPDGVDVVCSGRRVASDVMPDDVIEVPDEVYQAHGWAEELWSVVAPAAQPPAAQPRGTATKKKDEVS